MPHRLPHNTAGADTCPPMNTDNTVSSTMATG